MLTCLSAALTHCTTWATRTQQERSASQRRGRPRRARSTPPVQCDDPYLGEVDPQSSDVIQFTTSQSGEHGASNDRGLGGARPEHVAGQSSGPQQGDVDVAVREYVKLATP